MVSLNPSKKMGPAAFPLTFFGLTYPTWSRRRIPCQTLLGFISPSWNVIVSLTLEPYKRLVA
jgi:hypothetical protein